MLYAIGLTKTEVTIVNSETLEKFRWSLEELFNFISSGNEVDNIEEVMCFDDEGKFILLTEESLSRYSGFCACESISFGSSTNKVSLSQGDKVPIYFVPYMMHNFSYRSTDFECVIDGDMYRMWYDGYEYAIDRTHFFGVYYENDELVVIHDVSTWEGTVIKHEALRNSFLRKSKCGKSAFLRKLMFS